VKLFPPIFRSGAAILSEKIDALAQATASILNGGLDADNLAPGLQLPLDRFLEQRGLFVMRACFNRNGGGGDNTRRVAYFPFAARLVGWGLSANRTFPDTHFTPILRVLNGAAVIAEVTPSKTPPAFQDWGRISPEVDIAAGDVISVQVTGTNLLSPEWGYLNANVSLLFDATHQA
jgi:hypothetical protein